MKRKIKNNREKLLIGRHISLTKPGFLLDAAKKAVFDYKCNSFMIYLGAPQNSFREDVNNLKVEEFKRFISENSISIKNIVVHGSYLINFGNYESHDKLSWSINFMKADLLKMAKIGLETIVIHPGNSLKLNREESMLSISRSLDIILSSVSNVKIALETMPGSGTQIGKDFDEIKFIIENSKFSDRIGVCWDTCHLYSSGYDIRDNFESVLEEFDSKIGIEKLWVIHLNDSASNFQSKKDNHANIGLGHLGLECLAYIAHDARLINSIKILETPVGNEIHKKEIENIRNFDLI